jgi:microcompartment protein CcmL/EutN
VGMRVSKGHRGKGVIPKIKENTKEVLAKEQEKEKEEERRKQLVEAFKQNAQQDKDKGA